jgi:hypothetical protein
MIYGLITPKNKGGRMKKKDKKEIIAEIKNKLQYPKTTLEVLLELKAGKRKRMPEEFIKDALKAIDQAVRLLNKLAEW